MKSLFGLIRRKALIHELGVEIADLQRRADEWYYIQNDKEHASWLLDRVDGLRNFAIRLGISDEAYQVALSIYDFRNSGRNGYTLKDGKIVEEESDE